MRGLRPFLAIAAVVIASSPVGQAFHCDFTVSPNPEIDTGETPLGTYYVENDLCQPECTSALWVYEESNGIAGLQRGDVHWDDNHCGIRSDTIIAEVYR